MQDSTSNSNYSNTTSNDLTRASGLARFRSAPATWLDALLEDDDDPLKLSGQPAGLGLTQLLNSVGPAAETHANTSVGPGLASGPTARPGAQCYGSMSQGGGESYFESGGNSNSNSNSNSNTAVFQRMNSSPAEFLSGNMDGYFSSFGGFEFEGGGSSSSKRLRDNDTNDFSSQRRGEQSGQLSTANSLVELEMEKLLEDSVPCRVRAKRGCATHPRSIAERVRRTRISDRIRKLQELVPNMDKQTNTADMLEEAVEYVKTLQRQIQELTEQQKKCKCMAKS